MQTINNNGKRSADENATATVDNDHGRFFKKSTRNSAHFVPVAFNNKKSLVTTSAVTRTHSDNLNYSISKTSVDRIDVRLFSLFEYLIIFRIL